MMGKIVPIAFIPESATANWIDSTVANKDVRDALEEFVAELEWGSVRNKLVTDGWLGGRLSIQNPSQQMMCIRP